MKLPFTKMQGLGNDFVVIDAVRNPLTLTAKQVRFLSDRHKGIGCDQLLLIQPTQREDVDFEYRIFNADGSEVGQCGNGARCVARFLYESGLASQPMFTLGTRERILTVHVQPDHQVTVDMGVPLFDPQDIPFLTVVPTPPYKLQLGDDSIDIWVVNVGNPHAVLFVNTLDTAVIQRIGAALQEDPHFPQRVNVGFVRYLTPERFQLRVYERGTGETLACGSGACAAMAIARHQQIVSEKVVVELLGGELHVAWAGGNDPILMTGPADVVFVGEMDWPLI